MVNTASLTPGDLIVATVRLRPMTRIRHPELIKFDGQRSTFAAAWIFYDGPHCGEIALIHESWPLRYLLSGDVTHVQPSDEDLFASDEEPDSDADLIDFLDLTEPPKSDADLRRCDLAELRYAVANPGYARSWVSKSSRLRLTAYGMVETVGALTFPTAYGFRTARYNASCRSGYEGQPQAPGAWRQAREDGSFE